MLRLNIAVRRFAVAPVLQEIPVIEEGKSLEK